MLAATTTSAPHDQEVSSDKPQHRAKSDDDQADSQPNLPQDATTVAVVTIPVMPAPQLPVETTPVLSTIVDVTASTSATNNTATDATSNSSSPMLAGFAEAARIAGIQLPVQTSKASDASQTVASSTVASDAPATDATTDTSADQQTATAVQKDQPTQKLVDARLAAVLGQNAAPAPKADTKQQPQVEQPATPHISGQSQPVSATTSSATTHESKPEHLPSIAQAVTGQSTEQPANQIANPHAVAIPHIELGTSSKHADVADQDAKGSVSGITGAALHTPAVKPARNEEADTQSQSSSSDQGKAADAPVQQAVANGQSAFSVDGTGAAQSVHVPAPQATHYSAAAHAADQAQPAVAANVAAPVETAHVQPLVNTARLIQNMHETEMRVGIRSEDFGNISISTSANRESITAQISVEHDELAKTIAAGLPEMQTRLGSDQPLQVRIASGAHAGTMDTATGSSANSNSNADNGSQWRQSSSTRYQSDSSFISEPAPRIPAFVRPVDIISNSRLDIRA